MANVTREYSLKTAVDAKALSESILNALNNASKQSGGFKLDPSAFDKEADKLKKKNKFVMGHAR